MNGVLPDANRLNSSMANRPIPRATGASTTMETEAISDPRRASRSIVVSDARSDW